MKKLGGWGNLFNESGTHVWTLRFNHIAFKICMPVKAIFFTCPEGRGFNMGLTSLTVKENSPYNIPRRPGGEREVYLYSFFNLGARWVWVVNDTPRPLCLRERTGTHSIGGWVPYSRSGQLRKISSPRRDSIPVPSSL